MSRAEPDSKLVLRAEATVAEVPLREPDWDALAAKVDATLGKAGPTDDSLLLPPLPESIEDGRLEVEAAPAAATPLGLEGVAAAASADSRAGDEPSSQRDGASLADLARAAVARRGAKEAVSLAKESLAIASQGRGSVEAAVPTIVTERERRTVPPARRGQPTMDTRGPWIGVAVAAMGLAAGFGLYLSSQRTTTQIIERPVPQAVAPAPSPTHVAAEVPRATPDLLPAEPPAPRTSAAEEPSPIAAEALAPERVATRPSSLPAEARSAQASSPSAAHAEKVVLEEEHPSAAKTAVARPVPTASATMRPAELNASGGMSDRPTTGAAQVAVGAVLGAARSCLAGQPQASSAAIVFGSSGQVTSVSVSGPAQGTPAAACIQSALSKARVQAFAASSFSLGVTVRPP